MKKKGNKKNYKKRLDVLVSKYTIARDKKCVICGSTSQPTNGHLFSRRYNSLRWDTRDDGNCHQQCWPCNFRHVRDTVPYFNWYIEKYGKEKFDILYKEWNSICQMKDGDIEDLYWILKTQLFKETND